MFEAGSSSPYPPAFPIMRHFLFWSLSSAVVVAVALSLVSSVEIKDELMEKDRRCAELVASAIQRQVLEHFDAELGRGVRFDPTLPRHQEILDTIVRRVVAGQDVEEVCFFNEGGVVLYSTRSEHRGLRSEGNEELRAALEGATEISFTHGPSDLTGKPYPRPLLEAYVPAAEFPVGRGFGRVIELYMGAEAYATSLRHGQGRLVLTAVAAMILLLLCNLVIVRRGALEIERGWSAARESLAESERANARLEEMKSNLEEKVRRAARELSQAEKLAGIGTLAAGMAHEVNTPLASIATCAQALLRKHKDLPDEARHDLEVVKSEAFRCKGITQKLLDFARCEREPSRAPFDVVESLRGAIEFLAFEIAERGVLVETDFPEEKAIALGDADAWRQVVLNVLHNALDALKEGEKLRVGVALVSTEWIRIDLRDEGVGIDAADLSKVFEPFFTTKEPGQGTGQGLSVSYGIVKRHGGSMEIRSAGAGQGTTVVISLPRSPFDMGSL